MAVPMADPPKYGQLDFLYIHLCACSERTKEKKSLCRQRERSLHQLRKRRHIGSKNRESPSPATKHIPCPYFLSEHSAASKPSVSHAVMSDLRGGTWGACWWGASIKRGRTSSSLPMLQASAPNLAQICGQKQCLY
eukprot:1145695-Pelagomonas_calceolata.AAC.5